MNISKKYNPQEIEDKWYQAWMDAKVFKSVPDEREPYTIVIPPPNVTGILHMGHILNNTLQDVLIRRKRMQGYNACWVPGTDHASIATEAKVVQMLAEKGIDKRQIGREAFLKYAFEWKEKYGGIILQQLRKLGASCDWDRTAFTMDEEYSRSVIEVFCRLYEKGLIYRGIRMVNWDPEAQTAVSDEEVIHKETHGKLYYVRYALEGEENQYVTIATTRPETILGDTAVSVHPEDERYTHLHGKRVLVPLVNRPIPIIQDEYVKMDFGTGCLKVTPAHDPNDYEIGLRHRLPSIDIFNDDGTVNEAGQLYIGQDRMAVRKQIVKDLQAAGQIDRIEDYVHEVGYSERTGAAIEPRLSLQWFLRMKEISQPALKAVLEGEIQLIPEKFVNTYKHWMENVRDWCLSRQLWWGHRIPAYYIQGSNEVVVAPTPEEARQKAIQLTGNADVALEQDPDVLDTWASSWLWPISVFNGITRPGNPDISYYYPTNDLVTAPEILFFWVARMIIAGYEFMGEKPFSHVYLTGIVRDKQRRKMSKSLGNSPDPLDLIAANGADGVRVGMLLCSPAGNDLLYDDELVKQGRNFANKIWNAFRLVKSWKAGAGQPLRRQEIALHWMRERLKEVALEIEDHFEKFRISDALMSVYKLSWDDFCSSFLEMIKPEYGQPIHEEVQEQVLDLFEELLKLLHPFMPFITEEIWQGLRPREEGAFIAIAQLASLQPADSRILEEMALIQETITAVRAFKKEKNISHKEPISLFVKTQEAAIFEAYQPVLSHFLNLEKLQFVDEKVAGAGSLRVRAHEFYIPLKSVDIAAEREKILKEIDYTRGFLKKVEQKLANERFVNNAPEKVVALERKKKADSEAKLAVLENSLRQLEEA
ncbi:MAG: valine--tRNA ligase [Bacteroidetes bacterium]|nr:MAG: valine--tRNA ligase [Bacteroidota bacterium]